MDGGGALASIHSLLQIVIASSLAFGWGFLIAGYLSRKTPEVPENVLHCLGTLLGLALGSFYLHTRSPIRRPRSGADTTSVREAIAWGACGGLVLVLLNFPYAVVFQGGDIPAEHFVDTQQKAHFVLLYVVMAVVAIPIAEELFFRAGCFGLVRDRFGPGLGYVVATVLFAAAHRFSLMSIVNSLIFCYIYERSGRIGASIVSHFLQNLTWYAAVYMVALR